MTKLNIYKAIPNSITLGAFVFGFTSIKLAINGEIKLAILFVIMSAILDLFDGRIARILGVEGKFGAELDSLSDMVCFGVATPIIVLFAIDSTSTFLFFGGCFFAISAMLRLARFNTTMDNNQSNSNTFSGVPTPAAFALGILPLCIDYSIASISPNAIFYSIYLIFIGFLMISNLPTPSTKSIKLNKKYFSLLFGIISLILVGLVNYVWISLSILSLIYLACVLIYPFFYNKNK
jgi:CDP-diacylglycerol--serine O-phosphatidyltransferase